MLHNSGTETLSVMWKQAEYDGILRVRRNSLIYLSSKPRPPRYRRSLLGRPPSRHSLEPVPRYMGALSPAASMFSISAICNMSTRFSRSDWQTFDAEQSWVRLERWSASTRDRNDRTSPVESYEQAGVTCTRSGMPASHSRLLCLQEQGSSF